MKEIIINDKSRLDELKEIAKNLALNNIWNQLTIDLNKKILDLDELYIAAYTRLGKCYTLANNVILAQLAYEEALRLSDKKSLPYKIATNHISRLYDIEKVNKKYSDFYSLKFSEKIKTIQNFVNKEDILSELFIHEDINTIYYVDNYIPVDLQSISLNRYTNGMNQTIYTGKRLIELRNNNTIGIDYYYNKLMDLLKNNEILSKATYISCMPSNEAGDINLGLETLVKKITKNMKELKYTQLLCRTHKISTTIYDDTVSSIKRRDTLIDGIFRANKLTHMDTLKFLNNENTPKNSTVILLDDIVTSGASLAAGYELIKTNDYNVIKVALGNTALVTSDFSNEKYKNDLTRYELLITTQ